MLNVIRINEVEEWNNIVKSFPLYDSYYTYYYVLSLSQHGDGEPLLLFYKGKECDICYVVMQKDISADQKFSGLAKDKYFDWETPYGYGGPLVRGIINNDDAEKFKDELFSCCKESGVVSQFIRFNPLTANHSFFPSIIESVYLRNTVFIDTSSEELISSNMDSKNRNVVRKAVKNNVQIVIKSGKEYADFIGLYNSTMKKDNALDYYYFTEQYYETLSKMGDNEVIFYAYLNDKPIAASIFLIENGVMHYHLSGSDMEYRPLCPSNLLLYEASVWCSKNGIGKMHLGGGLSNDPDDNLLRFKKQFNKNGMVGFYVGRTIFDQDKYDYLCLYRKERDNEFDINNKRMIQYRQ